VQGQPRLSLSLRDVAVTVGVGDEDGEHLAAEAVVFLLTCATGELVQAGRSEVDLGLRDGSNFPVAPVSPFLSVTPVTSGFSCAFAASFVSATRGVV
jgi:hypothetical protein